MSNANDRQVGGSHYMKDPNVVQHWDYAVMKNYDMFQYNITQYIERWRDKNGIMDLEKALHFLEKYIEVEKEKLAKASPKIQTPAPGMESLSSRPLPFPVHIIADPTKLLSNKESPEIS